MKFIKENWPLVLSLLYIISPWDFIPEFILGPLGIIDDVTIALPLFFYALFKAIRSQSSKDLPTQ